MTTSTKRRIIKKGNTLCLVQGKTSKKNKDDSARERRIEKARVAVNNRGNYFSSNKEAAIELNKQMEITLKNCTSWDDGMKAISDTIRKMPFSEVNDPCYYAEVIRRTVGPLKAIIRKGNVGKFRRMLTKKIEENKTRLEEIRYMGRV